MRSVTINNKPYELAAINHWDFAVLSKAIVEAAQIPNPVVVEVGTLVATTTRALLAALRAANAPLVKYIGIDIDDRAEDAFELCRVDAFSHGQTDVSFIRKPSLEAAPDIADESCAMVFVDACHCFNCAMQDIEVWAKKVRRNGFLCFHDANPAQGLRPAKKVTHPGSNIHGVGKALAQSAEYLDSLGYTWYAIGKPDPKIPRAVRKAWTAVYRRTNE